MPPPADRPRFPAWLRTAIQACAVLHLCAWTLGGTLGLLPLSIWLTLADVTFIAGSVLLFWGLLQREPVAPPDVLDVPGEPPPPTIGEGPFREGPLQNDPGVAALRERKRLRWIVLGVGVALVAQGLIPLRYYLGDDAYDERFSWRMFSAVRMQECNISASETVSGERRAVRLMETVQVGWITTLRRNREAVMQRYLEWRCEQPGVERARLENACRTPEGVEVPTIVRDIDCATSEITAEGGI